MKKLVCAISVLLLAAAATQGILARADEKTAEAPLSNADVVKLCKSGLGDKVVLAKIKESSKVDFKTGTDDLVKLKSDGCSSTVIEAMLDRSGGSSGSSSSSSSGGASSDTRVDVKLVSTTGEVQLSSKHGKRQQIVAPFVGYRHFMVYPEMKAQTRIKDKKPSILVATSSSPVDSFFIVTLSMDDDDNDRSLDLLSPGAWGGSIGDGPEGDSQIDYIAKEEKPGLWRLTPKKDLKAGEYGLFEVRGDLYDFGVDK